MSSSLVVQLKLKCSLKKQTHDDIIEAKEVYIQQSFGRYKGKLVLRNLSPSVTVSSFKTTVKSPHSLLLMQYNSSGA